MHRRPLRRSWVHVSIACLVALSLVGCDQAPSAAPSTAAASTTGQTLAPPSSDVTPAASGAAGSPGPTSGGAKPTSADLIRADVAAGKLDGPTGLLYRIYAIFGDPRLPVAYESDVWDEDSGALLQGTRELDTLPAAIADEMRPFLVRPTDPSSVFREVTPGSASAGIARLASVTTPVGAGMAAAAPASVVCNPDPLSDWGYALGQANFKVWGACGDPAAEADIQQVVAMVDSLWDAESTFLGREPVPDSGAADPDIWLNDAGGDERIDLYLVSPCVTRGGTCHAVTGNTLAFTVSSEQYSAIGGVQTSSGFVVIPASALAAGGEFRSVLAHELFHVFENAMNVGGMWDGFDWHWFEEASALWAEWHFVTSVAPLRVAPFFGQFQQSTVPLDSTAGQNEYDSFAWPLFMEEHAGGAGVIANAWHAIEGKASHAQVTDALDGLVSFKDTFREFAVRNWNEALGVGEPLEPLHPEPPTGPARPKPAGGHRWGDAVLHAEDPGDPGLEGQEHILGLYARYVRFTVDDDVGQVILDLSGMSSPDRYDADALLKVKDKGWEHRKVKKGKTTWCMDNPDDDIEEFVLILSNHDKDRFSTGGAWTVKSPREPCLSYKIHIDWTDVYGGIGDHFTFDGWADTIDPNTSGNGATTLTGTGTLAGTRSGWAGCNPGLDEVPSGSGPALFVASIAGDQLSIGAFPDLASTDFGVSTEPFTFADRKGGTLRIASDGNVGGDLCPHSWFGTMTATMKLKEPLGNEEGP